MSSHTRASPWSGASGAPLADRMQAARERLQGIKATLGDTYGGDPPPHDRDAAQWESQGDPWASLCTAREEPPWQTRLEEAAARLSQLQASVLQEAEPEPDVAYSAGGASGRPQSSAPRIVAQEDSWFDMWRQASQVGRPHREVDAEPPRETVLQEPRVAQRRSEAPSETSSRGISTLEQVLRSADIGIDSSMPEVDDEPPASQDPSGAQDFESGRSDPWPTSIQADAVSRPLSGRSDPWPCPEDVEQIPVVSQNFASRARASMQSRPPPARAHLDKIRQSISQEVQMIQDLWWDAQQFGPSQELRRLQGRVETVLHAASTV
mmetsp:Transcript_2163/g.5026  ORF Transcript_2163/g.5026 Transcript_2163/m.5026 type:complete len:322 (+) Transcript_2163:17-982(+)